MYTRDRPFHPPRRKTPSFSSSLLEAIYQSIDESEGKDECSSFYGEGFGGSVRKQSVRGGFDHDSSSAPCSAGRRGFTRRERVIMIEEWMEKQGSRGRCFASRINSGSSTSDSSSGGRTGACSFSSSETESGCRKHRTQNRMPTYDDGGREKTKKDRNDDLGGGISRTKLRAMKIYGELKKAKQPISPGGKISAFLNSIFNSGNVKKAKMCYVGAADDVSSFDHKATTLSSVSSYSKPCMSKTPSTRKLSADDGTTTHSKRSQRSVRFYPSEAVAGDDIPEPFCYRTVLRSCPSYKEKDFATKTKKNWLGDHVHEDEDEEYDCRSCSSSDLFELGDHLISGEELSVYETTSLKRNHAITHGFIV